MLAISDVHTFSDEFVNQDQNEITVDAFEKAVDFIQYVQRYSRIRNLIFVVLVVEILAEWSQHSGRSECKENQQREL